MSDSIPDVILRLARRHIPSDATMPVHQPAQPEPEVPEPPLDPLAPLPPKKEHESVDGRVAATSADSRPSAKPLYHEPIVTEPILHDPPSSILHPPLLPAGPPQQLPATADQRPQIVVQPSRLHAAGETPAPQPTTSAHADESTWAPSEPESFVDSQPAFDSFGGSPTSFEAGPNPPPRTTAFPSRDSFQPADRSATTDSSPDQSPVEAVSETSRRLEQTARDLETSLTHLFTTQIESLQRLRDRVDEQERRWVEQQSARRAAL